MAIYCFRFCTYYRQCTVIVCNLNILEINGYLLFYCLHFIVTLYSICMKFRNSGNEQLFTVLLNCYLSKNYRNVTLVLGARECALKFLKCFPSSDIDISPADTAMLLWELHHTLSNSSSRFLPQFKSSFSTSLSSLQIMFNIQFVDFYLDVYVLDLSGTIRKRHEILMFVLYHIVSCLDDVRGLEL